MVLNIIFMAFNKNITLRKINSLEHIIMRSDIYNRQMRNPIFTQKENHPLKE